MKDNFTHAYYSYQHITYTWLQYTYQCSVSLLGNIIDLHNVVVFMSIWNSKMCCILCWKSYSKNAWCMVFINLYCNHIFEYQIMCVLVEFPAKLVAQYLTGVSHNTQILTSSVYIYYPIVSIVYNVLPLWAYNKILWHYGLSPWVCLQWWKIGGTPNACCLLCQTYL